jgi:hypothetical protein
MYVKPYTYVIYVIQLQLCRNNYCVILMQLVCNYNGNVTLTSFFINPSKFDMWQALWQFLGENYCLHLGEILISIIHYDRSFIIVLDYDMWHN